MPSQLEDDVVPLDDQDEHQNLAPPFAVSFTRPSLNQILCAWLALVSGSRLAASVPTFFLASTHDLPIHPWNMALNVVLCVGSLTLLVKSLQKINYNALEDLEQTSLARQAGQWALQGQVPTVLEYSGLATSSSIKAGGDHGELPLLLQEARNATATTTTYHVATLAGGCFWGTEMHFQRLPGVLATCVGYTQGRVAQPTYEQVCSGSTSHTEAVQVLYDPNVCSYERLLQQLFNVIDPTLMNRVGNDRGTQYRHGIYYHDTDDQANVALRVWNEVQGRYGSDQNTVVTELLPAQVFWPAENYHQRYLEKRGQSAAKNCHERVRCYG